MLSFLRNTISAPWTIGYLLISFAIIVGFQLGSEIVVHTYFSELSTGIMVLLSLILSIAFSCLMLFFAVRAIKFPKNTMNFGHIDFMRIIASCIIAFLSYTLLMISFHILQENFGDVPGLDSQEPITQLFFSSPTALFLSAFLICILAPIAEELFFRGLVLHTLKQKTSTIFSHGITALLFTSMHMQFESFIPLFLLSIILGILIESKGSMWYPIGFHIFNNTLTFLLLLSLPA